jgi:hypothetical protein
VCNLTVLQPGAEAVAADAAGAGRVLEAAPAAVVPAPARRRLQRDRRPGAVPPYRRGRGGSLRAHSGNAPSFLNYISKCFVLIFIIFFNRTFDLVATAVGGGGCALRAQTLVPSSELTLPCMIRCMFYSPHSLFSLTCLSARAVFEWLGRGG